MGATGGHSHGCNGWPRMQRVTREATGVHGSNGSPWKQWMSMEAMGQYDNKRGPTPNPVWGHYCNQATSFAPLMGHSSQSFKGVPWGPPLGVISLALGVPPWGYFLTFSSGPHLHWQPTSIRSSKISKSSGCGAASHPSLIAVKMSKSPCSCRCRYQHLPCLCQAHPMPLRHSLFRGPG